MLDRLGLWPLRLPVGMQVGLNLLDALAVRAASQDGVEHVVGDDRRPAAVFALVGGGIEPFEGGLADVSRSVSAIAAKKANSSRPCPVGS
ncbi:hypothetical protein [Streptomyces thermolilacinus]|uniref:hypothetical protein n=1 Tax=Streptomyces thermolilacinus TaxID=285540 RepID=UPI0033ECD53C